MWRSLVWCSCWWRFLVSKCKRIIAAIIDNYWKQLPKGLRTNRDRELTVTWQECSALHYTLHYNVLQELHCKLNSKLVTFSYVTYPSRWAIILGVKVLPRTSNPHFIITLELVYFNFISSELCRNPNLIHFLL